MCDFDQKAKEAVDLFSRGFSCGQSVFAVFSDEVGVTHDTA